MLNSPFYLNGGDVQLVEVKYDQRQQGHGLTAEVSKFFRKKDID